MNPVDTMTNTNPTPITEELKFFSASVRCPWGFSVCIVKAVSEYDAKIKIQEKFGDRHGTMIYQIILNEIDIKNNDVIEVFNK